MMRFLIKYRRTFMLFSFLLFLLALTLPLMGCGVPVWLSDAGSIIGEISLAFTSVASFIAGLTGNVALAALLATVATWITKVQAGISDLQTLISQYQASPNPGLLGDIESALSDLQTNVAQDFSNLGLPAAVLNVIAGIAGLANRLLLGWSQAISGVKTAKTSADFKVAMNKFTVLADGLPQSIAQFKSDVNAILTTKTGDAAVDAALAKTPKI
jgi:hypothetical protein